MHQLPSLELSMTGVAGGDALDSSWKESFRDRSSNRIPRQPDFKHKSTGEPLWMDHFNASSWVREEQQHTRTVNNAQPSAGADALSPSLIWACGKNKDLQRGTRIHVELQKRGLVDKYSDALVTMYAKCGELQKAQALLDKHNSSYVVPWTALIAAYVREGKGQEALHCFEQMQRKGIFPNELTYVCILKACAATGAIDKGKEVHDGILRQGLLEHHIVLGGALVHMYAKCGALCQAQCVLEKLPSRNVVCWNALIAGYVRNGQGQQALHCFEQMQREGVLADDVTYMCTLKACAAIGAIDKGKEVHDEISRQGLLEHHIVLGGALVDMYAKFGDLCQAQRVLEKLPSRNVVCWNALIAGYAQNGQGQRALDGFEQMQHEGILPNEVTYLCTLKACAAIGAIDKGKKFHDEISRQGLLEYHIVLGGALVDMYAKCGDLRQAQSVLENLPSRDVVSWTALISGYAQSGECQQALHCFKQMQHEGILPNEVTYVSTLLACATIGAIDKGKEVHDEISRQGLLEHHIVLGGALVDMYAKCGDLCQAQSVLEKLPSRDVVCWNALIAGYAQNGQGQWALDGFEQMQHEGILPNEVTYVCTLKACAAIGAIDKGKEVHDEISRQGLLEHHIVLGGALVHMYAKCGALRQAQSVLEKLPSRNVVCWNALIVGYAQNGQGQQALDCFKQMQHEGILANEVTYVCTLKACAAIRAIDKGKEVHDEISRQGLLEHHIVLGGALVDMYAKCGYLRQAQSVLEKLPSRNVVCWNALISPYVQNGHSQQALDCFEQMQCEGILANEVTYVCILKACAALEAIDKGKEVHDEISRQGLLEHHIVLGGALVDMYAKCGNLRQAQSVLEKLPSRDIVCWTALIAGYAQNGQGQQALDSFEQMQREGILADEVTYVCILKACAAIGAIDKGKEVHDEISSQGLLEHHIVLGDALVDMYAKCGDLCLAQSVLEKLPSRHVVSWNALIAGYAQNRQGQQALDCFEQMQREGILANEVTYVFILNACATIGAIDKGKEVHDEISRQGLLEHHFVLGGALVDMYAKCGDLRQAQSVLEKLPSGDVVCWTAMIAGFAQNGQGKQALDCFEQMQREGILANEVTYVCILNACAAIGAIDKGKEVHDEISRQGLLEHHIVLGGALVDMYAKCGDLRQARSVLEKLPSRNVVCWTALIAPYAQNGEGQQALDCFEQMQHEGILANEVTYVYILNACAAIGAIDKGKEVHDEISSHGLLEHHIVLGGALVDMYAQCGDLRQAQSVLEELPSRDVVCWNALIAAYAQNGQGQQALDSFEQMQHEVLANEVTYVCILNACAATGAIDKGKEVHIEISRQGLLEHHIVLGGALVDMYAKCGDLRQAQSVLEKLPYRDVVCWTALIAGYAQNGQGQQALDCFEQMQREGVLPDEVTFCCLLDLCSHLGMVDKGQELFDSMEAMYGLKPNIETFACMADLLGRAGHLVKAVEVIKGMPFSADSSIWHCLLGACRKWVDVNVATWAFEQAVELDKCDGAAYISMVNIYAAAGMPEKAKDIEAMRIRNKAWKLPGCSLWTDPNNKVHEFCVDGDTKHAQSKEIDLRLEDMEHKMVQAGYYPNLNWVFDASKAQLLCRHSEKLALACALINTPIGGNIVIRKNMRICGDCHTAASFISKTEKRQIVVIDALFNHCFKDGRCSCNGYF